MGEEEREGRASSNRHSSATNRGTQTQQKSTRTHMHTHTLSTFVAGVADRVCQKMPNIFRKCLQAKFRVRTPKKQVLTFC